LGQYVLRRILLCIPTLLGISLFTFLLVHLSGDPADIVLPYDVTEETRQAFREKHGLDKPLWIQYYRFCGNILKGDFGQSLRFEVPAGKLVLERLGATTELAFAAMALAIVFGIPAGVVSACHQKTPIDALVRGFTVIGQAFPIFFLGLLSIIVFAVWLHLFPTGGRGTWQQLILPAATLATHLIALIARFSRSCMLDVLRQNYIRTARAKGLKEWKVVYSHALRNALIPLVTVIGLQVGFLMGGVVVTEIVFSWPGIGRLAVQCIYARDFPVIQAIVFLSATVFVVVNLIVDLLYSVLDPRIHYR
jgi:peptide/nickel transport system permease protein